MGEPTPAKTARNEDLVRYWQQGRTLRSLADEFMITPNRVRQILVKMGQCSEIHSNSTASGYSVICIRPNQ